VGKPESDPLGDKDDHNGIACSGVVDPIYQSLSESGSDNDQEVCMVGLGQQSVKKTIKEIARETEETLACAASFEQATSGKRHDGQLDHSGSFDDGAGDGARSAGHHAKYNQQCPY
jgi:hypothetical protein